MAVEIRELVIKALIVNGQAGQPAELQELPGGGPQNKDRLIQECVNQVLKIIRQSKSR